ncbi:glycoside hydrolase family 2 TIM barrel-domain containing protein [Mediterraneibacter glycyrrhizinilyticus]|uniref:glycoside hydrolase family 2 protein n=1 Tax=Mediterraneibacter glycyrrhizinilyticus TaxID=342942 RepID=UPI0025AA3CBF|nr:sugar-binding domain-containing protein [Mediterraneibacter glycyrrhizinilyticus]MDN0060493.1 glycoside hydrolase family 2 TIM barrel-domain containing protein [Mediterraneibacter glycyrrhizinilyticus]
MKQLYTRWGRELDPQNVLPEYPRPLLRRSSYTNLNGYWDYAFTREFKIPEKYDGQILVPFSPEAVLSGVSRQLMPDEYLWYRRIFIIEGWNGRKNGRRRILHFGAVDQACAVYVNGKRAARHTGGYLPFEADITQLVRDGENELIVAVKDLSDTSWHARGKQRLERGGMFYTAQSGIWQTVWMEEVPETYIQTIESVTDPDAGTVRVRVTAAENNKYEGTEVKTSGHQEGDRASGLPVQVQIHRPGLYTDSCEYSVDEEILCSGIGSAGEWIEIAIPDIMLWTCETPYLYFFTVTMGEDRGESYFAMRRFSVEKDEKGIPRICMNGEVQFQNGVLDQGYWPDGLYTAPSDEAMIFDITEMKRCGFNMVRKHIKIEPQRWYWHCDRLGIVVWQDMVNGGEAYRYWFVTYLATVMSWRNIKIKDSHPWLLARRERTGRTEFVREMKETIRLLKGHPSICTWVIFNEGWGQFQTKELTRIAREADPDRLIDPASGWFDQGGGDLQSVHNYFFRLKVRPEKERAAVLSEIGGHTYREPDHSACEELYGYGACRDKEALGRAYRELTKKVKKLIPQGLCASVYTQWTDIEEEINGVYTWDREVRKIL